VSTGEYTYSTVKPQHKVSTPTSPFREGEQGLLVDPTDASNWLLLGAEFWETAKEIAEENRANAFILLDAAMRAQDNKLLEFARVDGHRTSIMPTPFFLEV
jgi:hypothetical protein